MLGIISDGANVRDGATESPRRRTLIERLRSIAAVGQTHPRSGRGRSWLIDIGFVFASAMAIITQAVVLWFHLIFFLVIVAALIFDFRRFAIRLLVWFLVSTALVVWAVTSLDTPSEELSEIPVLTAVLILVFLVAQSRARTHAAYVATRIENETRVRREHDSLREQLEQSQRLDLLGRASMTVGHDLRNVLTIVRGCAAELQDNSDPGVKGHANEVLHAVERGVEMLDELVAVGRSNRANAEVLDLGFLLMQSEPLLVHLVPDGIDLRLSLPPAPIDVWFDRTSFMQVVMNLVVNSVDAIEESGSIQIALRRVNKHRGGAAETETWAVVEVSDTGAGISSADAADVFAPGFTTKAGSHSGLGLSTAAQIVARSQGAIEVESTPGAGTTVSVYLPVVSVPQQPRRCVIDVADVDLHLQLAGEFVDLGFEVLHVADPLSLAVDVAVIDADAPVHASAERTIRLNESGQWRRPHTRSECTVLVRRIAVAVPTRIDVVLTGPEHPPSASNDMT